MEHEGSLPCSQELATSPYSEPDEFSRYPHPTSLRYAYILILSSHLHLDFQNGLFCLDVRSKVCNFFFVCPMITMCPAHLNLLDFIVVVMIG
jgi:hypothetical protein